MPTKYAVKKVALDVEAKNPTEIVPRGTAFRSFTLLSVDGATDFNLQIGTDQVPLPVIVPGFVFANTDPCDSETDGLFGTWAAQPAASVELLIIYGGGTFGRGVA